MDFIPKSLLSDVKTLKTIGKKKSTEKIPRASATQVSMAGDQQQQQQRLDSAGEVKANSPKFVRPTNDVRGILSSASRSRKALREVALSYPDDPDTITPSNGKVKSESSDASKSKSRLTSTQNLLGLAPTTSSGSGGSGVGQDIQKEEHHSDNSKIITTRKEVAKLKLTMQELLKSLEINEDQSYPTEMHQFMHIIKEENKIYDTVFQELIRQVTVNMVERGEILSEIRERYSRMFKKIPSHILNLHTELVAHRKLNRRLSEELGRARENISEMMGHLEFVREHDQMVGKQASEAQEKLLSYLNEAESAEESMEEFHNLYKLQRNRLEQQLRNSEKEKILWVEATTNLALRMGEEYDMPEVISLQKCEDGRLRVTNHIMSLLSDSNNSEIRFLEQKIDEWRAKVTGISKEIVNDDMNNIECIAKVKKIMQKVRNNLVTNEPQNDIELGHRLLNDFNIYDVQSLVEQLEFWIDQVAVVSARFTSGRDLIIREEIVNARKLTNAWIEVGFKLIRRHQDNTSGDDYVNMNEYLRNIQQDTFNWMSKLETRVSGEDGIANIILLIQSQIEDRLALLKSSGKKQPLTAIARQQTIEALNFWIDQIGVLSNKLSNTAEREQHKVPLQVERWVAKVLEQMNTDMDLRSEDNSKMHTKLISWIVNLLLPKRNVAENAQEQFHELSKSLTTFNANLLRDGADLEMISDDKRDLRKLLHDLCEGYQLIGKKLLHIDFDAKLPVFKEPTLQIQPSVPLRHS